MSARRSLLERAAGLARRSATQMWMDASAEIENRFQADLQVRQLVVFDDIFPHPLSAYRIGEFNFYLRHFQDAVVYSTGSSFLQLKETRSLEAVRDEYESLFPDLKGRVIRFNRRRVVRARLAYSTLLINAFNFISVIERDKLPFVFTLYPGGTLCLDDAVSDARLARVCSSPQLKKVIVTQKVVERYLLSKNFLPADKIEFIFGGAGSPDRLCASMVPKKYFGRGKATFDICFVAHKYMAQGRDKGYDVFIGVARQLAQSRPDVFFHVVGPYDATDVDISGLEGRLTFYEPMETKSFPPFYAGMDIILSPNAPFLLAPGAFDGFPTGCCVEASVCGVAMFCTDPLQMNGPFCDGEDIVFISRDVSGICHSVNFYLDHPEALYALAAKGQDTCNHVYSLDTQMQPRLRILSQAIASGN